ncbi:MAG: hypothetical protein CMN32_16715 [Saprospirales bacterium]|nr:hypothetical protein [Saprospirales bacterium]
MPTLAPKLSFLFLFFAAQCLAQQKECVIPLWSKNYGGSGNEQANAAIHASDGSLLVAGYTNSTDGDPTGNFGNRDYWLLKLDSAGNILWEKTYGGTANEIAKSVLELPDGDLLLLGSTSSADGQVNGNHGQEDVWILRLSPAGNIVWARCYGGSDNESAEKIIPVPGGFVVAGYAQSKDGDLQQNQGDFDYWIFKIDGDGNLLWSKTYGGSLADWAYSPSLSDNGNLLITGSSFSDDGDITGSIGFYDYWVLKLSPDGNLIWAKNYGGPFEERAYNSLGTADGGCIITGATLSTSGDVPGNNGSYDCWILRLDADGNITWTQTYGGAQEDRAFGIAEAEDGYLISGFSSSMSGDVSNNYGIKDGWLLKLDDNGALLWEKNFGGSQDDRFYTTGFIPGEGFFAAGSSLSDDIDLPGNKGQRDLWVIRLGPDSLQLNLGNDTLLCAGESLTLKPEVDDATFLWQNGTVSDSFTVNSTGTYWVEADRQGCKARDTIEVEVLGEVPLELGNDTVLCAGETLMLQAQILADDFLWSTGSTANTISVIEPGTYWVEATAGQCKVADTIQVDFLTIEFDLGEDLLLCEGEKTTLDATVENADYLWQDGSTAPTYTVTEPGTYWVQVGESGCIEFDTVEISYQFRPDSILPNYEYICENEVIWLEPSIPGASYIWNDGSQNSKLRVIQPGDYRVTVLLNGCSFEDAISLRPCESCLYVPNAFSPDGNGINDVFRSFPVCEIFYFEMKVFDRWGNLLFESYDPSMGWDGRFKGKKLQPGTYAWWISYEIMNNGKRIPLSQKGEVYLML